MRSAYLSVRCVAKGVSPFHRDFVPSCSTICFPQSMMPAALQTSRCQLRR